MTPGDLCATNVEPRSGAQIKLSSIKKGHPTRRFEINDPLTCSVRRTTVLGQRKCSRPLSQREGGANRKYAAQHYRCLIDADDRVWLAPEKSIALKVMTARGTDGSPLTFPRDQLRIYEPNGRDSCSLFLDIINDLLESSVTHFSPRNHPRRHSFFDPGHSSLPLIRLSRWPSCRQSFYLSSPSFRRPSLPEAIP